MVSFSGVVLFPASGRESCSIQFYRVRFGYAGFSSVAGIVLYRVWVCRLQLGGWNHALSALRAVLPIVAMGSGRAAGPFSAQEFSTREEQ